MEIFIFHCNLIDFSEIKLLQPICSAFLYIPNPTTRLHLLYQPILHVNVCIEGLVVINYFTTFDQKTIALQQKKHNTRHNYSMGELTVCSATPEMKEEGRQQPLHYSPAHIKTQVNCCTFNWKDKMLYSICKAFHH